MRLVQKSILALVGVLVLAQGCVEKEQGMTRSQRQQLEQYISTEPTSPQHPLDISFEDKIRLIGYDLSPNEERFAPGATFTVTWHWKVERAVDENWNLFTHVIENGGQRNEDGNGEVRSLYGPGQWNEGEYIRDPQQITVGDNTRGSLQFFMGIWRGNERMRVVSGDSDNENRARALNIPIVRGAARPEPELPSLEARPAEGLTIDGQLNEAAWDRAQVTDAFVNTMTGGNAPFSVTARTLWDRENFYVAFTVADTFLKANHEEQDDHLWEEDCVEIMVDPDGDGRNYFELQVSPRNVSFDTRYDRRRVPQPIGHADWDSNLRSGVHLRGSIDDEGNDSGYDVEIAIPWTAFNAGQPPASPPSNGDTWRVNFYVMDSQEEGQRACGWSAPRVGDFHVPARFGRIQFVGPVAIEQAAEPASEEAEGAAGESAEAAGRLPVAPGGSSVQGAPTTVISPGVVMPANLRAQVRGEDSERTQAAIERAEERNRQQGENDTVLEPEEAAALRQ